MARGGEAGPVYFSFLWTGQHLGESEISGCCCPCFLALGWGGGLRCGSASEEGPGVLKEAGWWPLLLL